MVDFAIAVWASSSFVPGILLALALAPWLRNWLVAILAVLDLWLLTEIFATLANPVYVFGDDALPRLIASVAQVLIALVAYQAWRRLEARSASPAPVVLPQTALQRRRPIRSNPGLAAQQAA